MREGSSGMAGACQGQSPGGSFFHKESERCGVTVDEVLFTDGPEFAVAEKPRDTDGSKRLLHMAGIMVALTKHAATTTVATAKASAIHGPVSDFAAGGAKQVFHILGAGGGIAALKLDGLTDTRKGADGEHT